MTTAYQRLVEIRAAREPVTIVTSSGTFVDMVLVSLSADGKAIFKQITIVRT